MSHWGKICLLMTLTTLGFNPSLGEVSSTVGPCRGAFAATASQPLIRDLKAEDQFLTADTSDPDASSEEISTSKPRSFWGTLALSSLLLITASVVVLILGHRRTKLATALERQGSESEISDSSAPQSHQVPLSLQHHTLTTLADAPSHSVELPPSNSVTSLDETTRLVPVNIVDTLIKELTSPDSSIRRKAIWELGQRGNSAAIQPLVNSMMDADSKERSLILAALAEINSKSLKPLNQALALALQDPSPEVRKNAIRDLTRIYDSAAHLSRFLSHAIQDENSEVRETAQWALGQLNRIQPSASESHAMQELSNGPPDSLPEPNSQ